MFYRLILCCWLLISFGTLAKPISCDQLTEQTKNVNGLLKSGSYTEVVDIVPLLEKQYGYCQKLQPNDFHELFRAQLSAARKLNWQDESYLNIFDKAKSNLLLLRTNIAISAFEIALQEINYLILRKQLDQALDKASSTLNKYDINTETHQQVHKVHAQLARIYIYRGELNNAIESSITSIFLIKQFDADKHIHIGWLYSNLGAIYYHLRDLPKAKRTFLAAEKEWLLSYDSDHENFANIYSNIASVEKELPQGDLQESLAKYERAFEIYKKHYPINHSRILTVLSNLAVTSLQVNNREKADEYFQLFAENYDVENSRFNESGHHGSYISFLTQQGRINEAIAWFGKIEQSIIKRNSSYKMLFSGIDSFIKLYTQNNKLLLALQWAEFRIEKTVEFVYTISQDDALIIPFFRNENQREFLSFLSNLHIKIQQEDDAKLRVKSDDILIQALSVFNANKATKNQRLQFEFISSKGAKNKAQLLAQKSRLLQSASQAETSVAQLALLTAELAKINNKLKLVDANLSSSSRIKSYSTKDFQKLINNNQSIVYFIQSKSHINAVVLEHDRMTVIDIQDFEQALFENKIEELRASVQQANIDYSFQLKEFNVKRAIELYDHLITPLALKPHVTFVQTPLVERLPLAALVKKTDVLADKSLVYLAQEHQVSFITSLLSLHRERSENTKLFSSLAFGAPSLNIRNTDNRLAAKITLTENRQANIDLIKMLPSLPYTNEEIASFSKLLNNNRVYTQDQATESEVRRQINKNNYIISFATHALLVEYPSGKTLSALVLTPELGTSKVDEGLFTTEDIESMEVNAELVVLSACNSAFSENGVSNDLSGLAASFIFSGTKNVLVSTAQISDVATAKLMTEFYTNVDEGFSKALMKGMNAMINSEQYSHPYYWANFRLIGTE